MRCRVLFIGLFFAAAAASFAQIDWRDDANRQLDYMLTNPVFREANVPMVHAISMLAVSPNAWIGNWEARLKEEVPHHFSFGAAAAAAAGYQFFNREDDEFDRFAFFGAPVFRMGGFELPFDMAVFGIYLPLERSDRDLIMKTIGFDFRYRVIRENDGFDIREGVDALWSVRSSWTAVPMISVGLGAAFGEYEENRTNKQQAYLDINCLVLGDTTLNARYQAYTYYASIQFSKRFAFWDTHFEPWAPTLFLEEQLLYVIPYVGMKLAIGYSGKFGDMDIVNVSDTCGNTRDPYKVRLSENNGMVVTPLVFGGLGIKMLRSVLINIGASYDLLHTIGGLQIFAGFAR